MENLVSNLKITAFNDTKGSGNLKAFASGLFGGVLYCTGLKIMDGKHGLFVGYPSRKDKNDKYLDIAFPVDKATGKQIQEIILTEYQRVTGGKSPEPEPDIPF